MKVALYIRVSTEEQAKEGFSINAQYGKLKAFCFSQEWTIVKEYIEEGVSAKNLERPKIKEMLSELHLFDVVLVYKLDRLSRSVGDINDLLQTFEKQKVSFKSATEPYDTTTAQGKLLINIFASLAQFEREQLAERTQFGMMQKHEQGQRNGGRAPFGYTLVNGKLVIHEEEAKWVRFIFESFQTRGVDTVTETLNKEGIRTRTGAFWNNSAVSYVVSNPVYYGALRWNYRTKQGNRTYEEVIVEGNHEAIVSKEVFDDINNARKKRKNKGWKSRTIYPFTSLLVCKRCGHSMHGEKRKRADGSEHRFYKCAGRFQYHICDMPVLAEDTIEQEFIQSLQYIEIKIDPPDVQEIDVAAINKELKRIENRKERWKELYVEGDISKKEYKEKMDSENEKEIAFQQSLNISQSAPSAQVVQDIIENLKLKWYDISLENRKQILTKLFNKLEIQCIQSHKGGKGERPVIELTDIQLTM